ncbi:hypothetical protein [Paraferrimonas sp. SM1919]|uniref:hypothetical protein n=1 Tax=Paraferrimonas sp. SM1919 TaxID=2662263 RepID=UPI0013D22FB4|nr:hypothetical protein [Paraferrimonas sp. SM1919]
MSRNPFTELRKESKRETFWLRVVSITVILVYIGIHSPESEKPSNATQKECDSLTEGAKKEVLEKHEDLSSDNKGV